MFMFFASVGFMLFVLVALKPNLFWPILIVIAVGTSALILNGCSYIDEWLTGCILIAGFMAISIKPWARQRGKVDTLNHLHEGAFFLLIAYMIIQAFRGLLILESLQKIRWVVFFGMLGLLSYITSMVNFPVPSRRKISLTITVSFLIYLIVYVAIGMYLTSHGIRWQKMQNISFAGTTYAIFPLIVAMLAIYFLLQDHSQIYRCIGWVCSIIGVFASCYYGCRSGLIIITVFFFFIIPRVGLFRIFIFATIFIVILTSFSGDIGIEKNKAHGTVSEIVSNTFSMLLESSLFLWSPSETDKDRNLHCRVAFISISQNWSSFLFGYGYRTHGLIISPYLKKLYGANFVRQNVSKDASTEGYTALAVDTGFLGLLLLSINFLFAAIRIFRFKKDKNKVILFTLLLSFSYLFVCNILDSILFFLLFMPSGLLIQMSKSSEETQKLMGIVE